MVAVAVLFAVYTVIYAGFIFYLIYGFQKVRMYDAADATPKTTFSIVVPFRTEEHNLPILLDSISRLEYPKELFELIFINDASEDFSENIITKWRLANGAFSSTMIDNIRLSGSPKKDAISRAIPIVKGEFVITTDADCELPPTWLTSFNSYILETSARMIAAPVHYGGTRSYLDHFQRLDFLSLQGVTIGSFGIHKPFMCNGANFAYSRKLFQELDGFTGVDNLASGDDVFLLQKALKQFPDEVSYLKSSGAIVKTQPAKTWTELFNQRVRWASKAVAYDIPFAENLALSTLLANFFIVISVICMATDFFDWRLPLALFTLKLIPDWLMLHQTNGFFKNSKTIFPVFAALVYPFFVSVVAVWAIFGKYAWKGRRF